jgi:hypothetical protein
MRTSAMGNKIAGIVFFLCGVLCIFYLFYSQRLILEDFSFMLTRYSKVIVVAYAGVGFILFGVLYYMGVLIPYYKANTYYKAKNNLFMSVFAFPLFIFWLIITSVSFNSSEIRMYKILGIVFSGIMTLFCFLSFYSSLNTLKNFHKKSLLGDR